MMCVTSTRERVIRQQHSKHIQHSTSAHASMGLDVHQQQDHSRESKSESREIPIVVAGGNSVSVTSPASDGIVTSPTEEAVCNDAHVPKHKAVATVIAVDEANNNRNSYPELNDSSGSDSPRDTPVEPAIDLPSVNFENLLEAKETDILNDSFHSDSSQNSQSSTHHHGNHHPHHPHGCKHHQRSLSGTCNSYAQPIPTSGSMDDILAAEQMTPRIGDRHAMGSGNMSDSICSDSGSLTGDIQVHIEDTDLNFIDADSDRTPTQDENVITKVYANTEVRLRNKKKPTNQEGTQLTPANQDSSTLDGQAQSQLQTSGQPISKLSPEASPIWKRKSAAINGNLTDDVKRMSNISEASEPEGSEGRNSRSDLGGIIGSTGSSSDNASVGSGSDQYVSVGYSRTLPPSSSTSTTNSYKRDSPTHTTSTSALPKMTSRQHKRLYRIGLNLFNK